MCAAMMVTPYGPHMVKSARFAGWTAVAGALVGIAITPFMAAVWAYEPGIVWDDLSLLTRTVGPTLESWGVLSFGAGKTFAADGEILAESTAYEVYGKAFFLVYLLMLPVVRYVHGLTKEQSGSKWEARTWRVMWIGLIVAGVGDAVSYWGISLPDPVGHSLWGGGFAIEILAMLVVMGATTVYGIVGLRLRVLPIWSSLLLMAFVPIAVLTVATVTTYAPNAVVVPLSIIWAAIGVWVLATERRQRSTPHPKEATTRP
jgi:hypothetical protein